MEPNYLNAITVKMKKETDRKIYKYSGLSIAGLLMLVIAWIFKGEN